MMYEVPTVLQNEMVVSRLRSTGVSTRNEVLELEEEFIKM